MRQISLDENERVTLALDKYADTVRKICFMYMKNDMDVDDIFQEVFLRFMQCKKSFESDEHEKAWIIRVTINKCKDIHKSFWRKNIDYLDDSSATSDDPTEICTKNDLLRIVLSLPAKYKDVIYLFYYEGYTVPQISKILSKKENTIYSSLHRAKMILRERLGGDANEYLF